MGRSDNARKHQSRNPLQRWLIARFYRRLAVLLDGIEGATLLDAGCGEGFGMRELAGARPGRWVAVDVDADALGGTAWPPSVQRVQADVCRLPFEDRRFDIVIAIEVLEHLADPRTGLRELARVARGRVVLTVPNEPWFRLANLARGKNLAALGNDRGHVQHWSARGIAALVAEEFVVARVATAFPWTLVLAHRRPDTVRRDETQSLSTGEGPPLRSRVPSSGPAS